MNITAKVSEIREAVQNLNNITDGLRGLQDAIVPNERISAVMGQTIVPLIANLEAQCQRAIATCEQTTGECIQRVETVCVHVTDRLTNIEAELEDLREILDGLAQAATRKRRAKS